MAIEVTAELVATSVPQPVRVTVTGLTAGTSVVVEGACAGGSWRVPGGVLVAGGSDVTLVDNRAALNVPVTYRVLVSGAVVATSPAPVLVAHVGPVLQSIDGGTVVPFVWQSNGLPRDLDVHVYAAVVEGRQRPPMRVAPAGDGGGSLLIRTDMTGTARLREILRAGGMAVLRTDGPARDFPPVEVLTLASAPSVLWEAAEGSGLSSQRVHTLGYLLADDPEPSRAVAISDWADFNAAMVRLGWDYADLQDFLAGLPDWASAAQVIWDDL